MEMIVLGLLCIRDFTMYEIKQAIDTSISFFYSGSYGSIHPALKKLAEHGFVKSVDASAGGRARKLFSITDAGRRKHQEWLKSSIPVSRFQDEGLLRLFFLGTIPRKNRVQILEDYLVSLKHHETEILNIIEESKNILLPANQREGFKFRMLTAEFGAKYYEFEQDFYKSILKKMKTGEI